MNLRSSRGHSMLEVLMVAAISATAAAIAVPLSGNALGFFRLSGDARKISNAVALTKMRAASDFGKARLYVDLSTNRYHMETKTGTTAWTWQGGATGLSQGVSFGFGSISTPPSGTQPAIGQAPQCLDAAGTAIAYTACVVLNSRGIPVDASGGPTTADAVYVTDGTAVYGITLLATGMIQAWRTPPNAVSWTKQ